MPSSESRTKKRLLSKRTPSNQAVRSESPSRLLYERLALLEQKVRHLETTHEHLSDIFDTNTTMITDSLKMAEGMQYVMQHVLHLVYRASLDSSHGPRLNSDGLIDFRDYLIKYWLCMMMTDFATWLKSLQKEGDEQVEHSAILHPNDVETETVVFGG